MTKRYLMFSAFAKHWGLLALLVGSSLSQAEIVDRMVAIINNEVITLSELNETVDAVLAGSTRRTVEPAERAGRQKEFLEQMVDQRLMTQLYEKLEIRVTPEEVDQALETFASQYGLPLADFRVEIEKQGIRFEDYREQMKQRLLQTRFVEHEIRSKINVSEDEIKSLYVQTLGKPIDDVFQLTGLAVPIARAGGPEVVDAASRRALDVQKRLVNGEAVDAVMQDFPDGSVQSLGDMGSFRRGELFEALEIAVFGLEEGQISVPVETPQGFFVLKVVSRKKEVSSKSYDEAREQIFRNLFERQIEVEMQKYLQTVRKEAHVQILL